MTFEILLTFALSICLILLWYSLPLRTKSNKGVVEEEEEKEVKRFEVGGISIEVKDIFVSNMDYEYYLWELEDYKANPFNDVPKPKLPHYSCIILDIKPNSEGELWVAYRYTHDYSRGCIYDRLTDFLSTRKKIDKAYLPWSLNPNMEKENN